MRICVLMYYDNNIKNYGDINYIINKKYCEKYNLDIILSNNQKKYNNRHAAWERLPLLLDNITKYDYLIWIDADAFFYNDANNVVDIINNNREVDFIFSNDFGNKNINTGFFIVKNSQYSIDFLTKWAYDEEFYKQNPYPLWWDQGVLIDMFNKNVLDIKNQSVLIDYGILQHFNEHELTQLHNKPYIFHLAGKSNDIRFATSKKYLEALNLLSLSKPLGA
jgi:hypothetical protein